MDIENNSSGKTNFGYIKTESAENNLNISKSDDAIHDKNLQPKKKLRSRFFSNREDPYVLSSPIDSSLGCKSTSSCSLKSLSWVNEAQVQSPSAGEKKSTINDLPQFDGDRCYSRNKIDSSTSVMVQTSSKYLQNSIQNSNHENSHPPVFFIQDGLDINNTHGSSSSTKSVPEGNNLCCDYIGSEKGKLRKKLLLWIKIALDFILKYGLMYPLIIFCIWASLYIFFDKMALPGPGGSLFALIILEISAICLGHITEILCLPPLLGMISAGIILRNVQYINVARDLSLSISSPLRATSVVILLTRGAFSVNPSNIKKFRNVVPSLAIGSCIIEATVGATVAYFIIGFPIAWASLIGCIMSATTGAVSMPFLINIEKTVTDTRTDVNFTRNVKECLVIAKTACGLDAILAICMAEFCFGFIFGNGDLSTSLLKGPAEVAMGGAFGILWGTASGLLINDENQEDLRIIAVFSGGVMSLLGLTKIGYPRGGPLGVFLGSLIAISIWRHKKAKDLGNLTKAFDKLWFIFQPLLFGIIGARTDFGLVNWKIIGLGVICLAISITGRMFGSYLMTSWSGLTFRERLFLVTAWLPKGTVQAALGPVALDTAMDLGLGIEYTELAYQIMNLAATIIIIAGFTGTFVLRVVGPRILKRN